MEKILICLRVPAINKSFDLLVPFDMLISELTKLITDGVVEVSNNSYIPSGEEKLNLKSSTLLNPQFTLQSYGIKDGETIYLI